MVTPINDNKGFIDVRKAFYADLYAKMRGENKTYRGISVTVIKQMIRGIEDSGTKVELTDEARLAIAEYKHDLVLQQSGTEDTGENNGARGDQQI